MEVLTWLEMMAAMALFGESLYLIIMFKKLLQLDMKKGPEISPAVGKGKEEGEKLPEKYFGSTSVRIISYQREGWTCENYRYMDQFGSASKLGSDKIGLSRLNRVRIEQSEHINLVCPDFI